MATNAAQNNINNSGSFTVSVPTIISNSISLSTNNLIVDGGTIYVNSVANRVGIGTLNPTTTLDVSGSFNVTADVTIGGGASITGVVRAGAGSPSSNGYSFIGKNPGNAGMFYYPPSLQLGYRADGEIVWQNSGGATMLYINCGNTKVGVGTTTPNEKLTVVGNISATGTITANTSIQSNGNIAANNNITAGGTVAADTVQATTSIYSLGNVIADVEVSTPLVTTDELVAGNNATFIALSSTHDTFPTSQAVVEFHTNAHHNAGTFILPTITDNGDGSVTLTNDGVFVFASDTTGNGPYYRKSLTGGTFSLTDGAVNFVLANAANSALVVSTSNATVDNLTIFPVFLIVRNGNNIAYIDLDHNGVGLADKLELRLARTRRIEVEQGGLSLGATNTPINRTVTITSGVIWFASNHNELAVFDSSVNSLKLIYHSAPNVWTSAPLSAYNNTQYDDNSGTLQTLTNNRYAVNFVYRSIGKNLNESYIVLGQGNYTLGEAQTSGPPAGLPGVLGTSILVGRIIVQRDSNTPTQIDSAFDTAFEFSGVTDHNALANLQGGAAPSEFYHVSQTQFNSLQLSANTVIRGDTGGRFMMGSTIQPVISTTNVFFAGLSAGHGNNNSRGSNFIGYKAGFNSTNACCSNFMGNCAGFGATNAACSNFMGHLAGCGATGANNSNMFGYRAGLAAASTACHSNFFGQFAGCAATNANFSNFFGCAAGMQATNANNSNFFGRQAGFRASSVRQSNFIGNEAGFCATNSIYSNMFGFQAGRSATDAYHSNFLGKNAGDSSITAKYSNFLGNNAGSSAPNASYSNFLGKLAGNGASNANNANFLGNCAGASATNANDSNFIGFQAGFGGTYANNSNFVGRCAGRCASGAFKSNFIGQEAGLSAFSATNSNFLGSYAGSGATLASHSTFIGYKAGFNASTSSNSIAIGSCAIPSGPSQFVLGSATFPLSTMGSIPSGASVDSLFIRINGVNRRIPLF